MVCVGWIFESDINVWPALKIAIFCGDFKVELKEEERGCFEGISGLCISLCEAEVSAVRGSTRGA